MISPEWFKHLQSKQKVDIIKEVSALFAVYSTVASTVHTLIESNATLSDEYMDTFYETIHKIMDDLQNNKVNDAIKKLADARAIIERIRSIEAKQSEQNIESIIENI